MLGKTGTTFDPSAPVTRGQVASILARAYAVLAGSPLAAGDDSFTDDDGTTHEAAIDAVAAAGWVNGVDADTFNPHGNATSAQLSSMVARMLGSLVTEGLATPPVPPAEPFPPSPDRRVARHRHAPWRVDGRIWHSTIPHSDRLGSHEWKGHEQEH